jgi:DNA repair exonuclease SbcCD ATPase subunit
MVSFAIGLALADLAACRATGKPEFLILDEPFTELSRPNAEAIVEYLTGTLGRDKDTIMLISNEESLKGLVPNRIHVVKRNKITGVSV